jgi:heme/copper-type cytochrome/quinol oxidase subunit 2
MKTTMTKKTFSLWSKRFFYVWTVSVLFLLSCIAFGQEHVIRVVADKDSRFKIPGEKRPEITVKANEPVVLQIEAHRGKTWSRDGAVHGFTLLHAKDHSKVPGWDFELKDGMQEFRVNAPAEPGEYTVVCTVICSDNHENMSIRFVVVP